MVYNTKKAQGLPLNTIVIALLVVVVLVVLILAFTTNIFNFNQQIDEQAGATRCEPSNPIVQASNFARVVEQTVEVSNLNQISCQNNGQEIRTLRNVQSQDDGETFQGTICCGFRE